MSTHVMGKCWPLQMAPTPKAVLISLADNANDQGECFPSIDTICLRTCFGRTAVIEAIQYLEDVGLVVADRSNGRRTRYTIVAGRVGDLFASQTGTGTKPVRQPRRLRLVGGGKQSASRTASAGRQEEASADSGLFSHDPGANQSAAQTGSEDAPARDTDSTSPPRGPDPSASRTQPVRQADTNRQEPSVTVIEPSSAQARDDDGEKLSAAEIDRVLSVFPADQIPQGVSRNTLARFIRHRNAIRKPVSIGAWFELRARFAELQRDGYDLDRSLRQTMRAGLAIPVKPTYPGEPHADRTPRRAGLGQRVAENAERAIRADDDSTVLDGSAVHEEHRRALGSPD